MAVTGVDAPIVAVTVFTDGARVRRAGAVDVEAGLREVRIGGLPGSVDPASVRVAAAGHGLGLLNVEVNLGYRTDPLREDTARLRAEVDRLRDALQGLDDEDAAEQARLSFLAHLSEAAATALARAVGSGRAGHEDLARMGGHLSEDTAGALGRRREIGARQRAARRELEAAQRRLEVAESQAGQAVAFSEVTVTLEAAAATRAEVEVTYHVSGASWRPLYDLALDGERLAVSYLAEITQHSGEDWPAVELTLSTTRRGRRDTLPELTPWYIGRAQPVPVRAPVRVAMAAASGGPLPPPSSAKAAAPQAQPIVARPIEDGDLGSGQVYQVQRPLAVPGDGSPHKTTVARFELEAALDHLAVPVLAPEAYLRATVTNTSPVLLLPGPARVFLGSRFVGETSLETVAAGEEFELQLGVDDQVRVRRELRRRSTGKAVLGGTRTIDIGYEITVENHRASQARVSVHDHVPVSEDGDIKVRLREASPNPAEHSDLGELTWDLTLAPGQTATIRYRFTVDHPAQVTVTGL
jgi:uncharacterized protein (TIGR02231 family)